MKIDYFIFLYIIKLSLSKSINKKDYDSRSIEGDTLIDKILTSDKFDELADKIVDKALAKFKSKKSSLGLSKENMKKNATPEFKSNKDNISMNPKTKDRKHKSAATIDVDAVLQKKAVPSENLSFRYEHFKKIVSSTTSEKSNAKINYDPTDAKVENINENSVKREHSSKEKYQSDEKSKSDKDDDSRSKEQPNSDENINTDLSSENVTFNEKPKTGDLQMVRPQSGENQFGDEKIIHWNETDDDDSRESVKNTTKVEKHTTEPAPEVFNRADDENQSVSDDEKQPNASQQSGDKETKERKRMIRREGDKVFTLNESPDYAEYHEKVAELRKSLGTKVQ